MADSKNIEKKIGRLSPTMVTQLNEYIDELLLQKSEPAKTVHLRQTWAGSIKDFDSNFSTIELQKKTLEYRQK